MKLWIVHKHPGRAIVRAKDKEEAKQMAVVRDTRKDKKEFWADADVLELRSDGPRGSIMLR